MNRTLQFKIYGAHGLFRGIETPPPLQIMQPNLKVFSLVFCFLHLFHFAILVCDSKVENQLMSKVGVDSTSDQVVVVFSRTGGSFFFFEHFDSIPLQLNRNYRCIRPSKKYLVIISIQVCCCCLLSIISVFVCILPILQSVLQLYSIDDILYALIHFILLHSLIIFAASLRAIIYIYIKI